MSPTFVEHLGGQHSCPPPATDAYHITPFYQQDDPAMFELGAPISPILDVSLGVGNIHHVAQQMGSPDPNPSPPLGAQEQHQDAQDAQMLDVEACKPRASLLRDTLTLSPVDDSMHDEHVENGMEQRQ